MTSVHSNSHLSTLFFKQVYAIDYFNGDPLPPERFNVSSLFAHARLQAIPHIIFFLADSPAQFTYMLGSLNVTKMSPVHCSTMSSALLRNKA